MGARPVAVDLGARNVRPVLWLGQLVVLMAFWVVLVGKCSWQELSLGLGCAVLASIASAVTLSTGRFRLRWRGVGWGQAFRLVGYAFSGTWEILVVLARHLFTGKKAASVLRVVPYEALGEDAGDATRRALAIAYTTITPNFIVVGVDRQRGLLLYHQVAPTPVLEMTRKLGARG